MTANFQKKGFILSAITDCTCAQLAAMQGFYISGLMMFINLFSLTTASHNMNFIQIQLTIVSLGLYGLVALMIAQMSRGASIVGLLLYCIEQALRFADSGRFEHPIIFSVFLFMFFISIRGTFAYHSPIQI